MNLNLTYKYNIVLSLANQEVKMQQIRDEIEKSIKEYNVKSRTAKNVKEIIHSEIKEDLLFVCLSTKNHLDNPVRGLYLLSKITMEQLKNNKKGDLIEKIIRNKSFFKSVGEAKEVKNLKFEKSDKIEEIKESNVLNNAVIKSEEKSEIQGNNVNLSKINTLMNKLILLREQEREIIEAINEELKGGEINEFK
ncbi:hypothetical protein QTI29_12860 [Clostridium perfringens]|nr:hypothetical protein [Clostridium perfringens]